MGFSLTGAHVIFFVAAVIAAGAVSGVLIAITTDVSTSLSYRSERIQEQLDTEFAIINDPKMIPLSAHDRYIFYLKNIGSKILHTTNQTFQIFINGEIVSTAHFNFSDASIKPAEYTRLYIAQALIPSGDHTLRLVGPLSIRDEFVFTIP